MKIARKRLERLLCTGHALLDGNDAIGAAACFSEAAKHGSPEGSYMLGLMYSFDVFPDFIHDDRLAATCFARAAERGHTRAQMRLAEMHASGCGVEQSRKRADAYWLAAATAGDPDAQFLYAMFLFYDCDESERKKNAEAARHWLGAARDQGILGISVALRKIRQWEEDGILSSPEEEVESDPDVDPEEWSEQ